MLSGELADRCGLAALSSASALAFLVALLGSLVTWVTATRVGERRS